MINVHSKGFRNKVAFADALYFQYGGPGIYPEGVYG
jgi:hypothetical protein